MTLNRPCTLLLGPGAAPIEGILIDISDEGASLSVGLMKLPERFILMLAPQGRVTRLCKPIARNDDYVEVSFVRPKPAKVANQASAPADAKPPAAAAT